MKVYSSFEESDINVQSNKKAHLDYESKLSRTIKGNVEGKQRLDNFHQSGEILSSKEKSMLSAMFGSNEVRKAEFYGNSKIYQIQKGHLLDLTG